MTELRLAARTKSLQQTGHANHGFARRHATFRVSRLLSLVVPRGQPENSDEDEVVFDLPAAFESLSGATETPAGEC
jgi:hypothetical protein